MSKKELLKLFDNKNIRVVWDDELQEWFFSVVDVVGALTDSKNPTDYLKKMRKREVELDVYLGTNCPQVLMTTPSGKRRKTLAGNPEHLFRIIQSIPSPKAEPFKRWMAQVAAERLDQLQDPELSIEQAVADYRRLGYSENWINQRLKSIEVRKLLTDEWKRGGVQGQQFASLTDIITAAWSGRTTKQYKHLKGLHKESLRDNMTNVELLLNSLAEASATEISKKENPKGYGQNADVAKRGGRVAKAARNQLESQLGHSVVTSLNAKDYFKSLEQEEQKQIEDSTNRHKI
jgi:hypothetical protein